MVEMKKRSELLRSNAELERDRAYIWEAIEETLKIINSSDVLTGAKYAGHKAEHLRDLANIHFAKADLLEEGVEV